jgi:hypothetical protein
MSSYSRWQGEREKNEKGGREKIFFIKNPAQQDIYF